LRISILSVLLVFIIIGSLGITSLVPSSNAYNLDKAMLRYFLESQYVEDAGLLRAATIAEPDNATIYVANDNLLASRALAVLGSPLATKVLTTLNNNFSGGWNGKVDVLLGKDIPDTFYGPKYEVIGIINGYTILYEKNDESVTIKDWYNYADLLVYHALDRLLWGSRPEAEKSFLNLTKLWDGYGFNDTVTKNTSVYAVYKCALFIYLYRALEAAGSNIIYDYKDIYEKCLEIISKAQDPVKGGIHTDYRVVDGEIIIQGDMNTETTSIVVLALYSNYPEIIGMKARTGQTLNPAIYGYEVLTITIPYSFAIMFLAFFTRIVMKLM